MRTTAPLGGHVFAVSRRASAVSGHACVLARSAAAVVCRERTWSRA